MGIRINKNLGYGILLKPDGKDDRVNPEILSEVSNRAYETSISDFTAWLSKEETEHEIIELAREERNHVNCAQEHKAIQHIRLEISMLKRSNTDTETEFGRTITYDNEYGLVGTNENIKEVLLFSSIHEKTWSRYDDPIDYCEHTSLDPDIEYRLSNEVQILHSSGIYPWIGDLKRIGAGPTNKKVLKRYKVLSADIGMEPIGESGARWVVPIRYFSYIKNHRTENNDPLVEYMRDNFRPVVPTEIIAIMLWSGVFKDVKSALDSIRPMIYTYWS